MEHQDYDTQVLLVPDIVVVGRTLKQDHLPAAGAGAVLVHPVDGLKHGR